MASNCQPVIQGTLTNLDKQPLKLQLLKSPTRGRRKGSFAGGCNGLNMPTKGRGQNNQFMVSDF